MLSHPSRYHKRTSYKVTGALDFMADRIFFVSLRIDVDGCFIYGRREETDDIRIWPFLVFYMNINFSTMNLVAPHAIY